MKESKPYPVIEEEDDGAYQSSGSCLTAQEPAAEAVAYPINGMEKDFGPIPGLPQTWDELKECIEEGIEEYERGEYIPGDVVFKSIRERIRNYAS
jgi:hypothetical protein